MFNINNETNDDDDLFVPSTSSSSNLAHLFGAQADLKSSLIYTPPKQPKTSETQIVDKSASSHQQPKKLVCVKTITLSRLVDSTYSNIGKFGIAIIADLENADLIIYKTKQNILSTSKLNTSFSCQQVNDVSFTFTDDQTLSWLITFDSIKDKMDFMSELAKQGVSQEKQEVPHDLNKLDSANNIKEAFSSRLIAEKPEEEKTRADILGRMSKLGMSILPTTETPLVSPLPAIPSMSSKLSSRIDRELSESEPEEVIRTSKVRKFRGRHSESAIETMDLVAKPVVSPTTQYSPFGTNVAFTHQLMDPLNIYFAENRTHNSEVRMNLSQLGNKIDLLLNEMRPQNLPNRNTDERECLERRILELERKFGQKSTESAPSMNKNDDEVLELKFQLDEQVKENAQNALRFNETILKLKEDNDLLQKTLESERDLHSTQLKSSVDECETFKQSASELQSRVTELEALVENQKLKLQDFAEYSKQNQEDKLDRLAREAAEQELKRNAEFLQVSLDQSNKKIEELELLYQQVLESRTKDEDHFADLVKEAMNVMYQNVLTDSIDSTTNLDVRDLKKILQKHLKSTTFSIISQYSKRKDFDSSAQTQMGSVSPEFEVTV